MSNIRCTCRSGYTCGYCKLQAIQVVPVGETVTFATKGDVEDNTTAINNIAKDIEALKVEKQCIPYGDIVPTYDIGKWEDAYAPTDIVDGVCIPKGADTRTRIPINKGDVVEHNGCNYMSLVDKNTSEPTDKTVYEGKWVNLCEVPDVFNCVLGKKVDVTQAGDPVVFGKNICERVAYLEEQTDNVVVSVTKDADTGVVTMTTLDGTKFTFDDNVVTTVTKDKNTGIVTLKTRDGETFTFDDNVITSITKDKNTGTITLKTRDGKTFTFDDNVVTSVTKNDNTGVVTIKTRDGETFTVGDNVITSVTKNTTTGVVTLKTRDGETFTAGDMFVSGFELDDKTDSYIITLNNGAKVSAPAYKEKVKPHMWTGSVEVMDTTPADAKKKTFFTYTAPEDGLYMLTGYITLRLDGLDYTNVNIGQTHGDSRAYLQYRGSELLIGGSEDGNNIDARDNIYNAGGVNWLGALVAGETIQFKIVDYYKRAVPKRAVNGYNVTLVKVSRL